MYFMLIVMQGPSKKRKVAPANAAQEGAKKKAKAKGKDKAADRGIIPIPAAREGDDVDLSDEDLDMLEEYGDAVSFLGHLDVKGIAK